MTTREHLVHHLQELYSLERDFLAVMDEMHHGCIDTRLCALLDEARQSLRGELDTLERGLHLLSARYKAERSSVAMGLREAYQRFLHQQRPSREQYDIHAALSLLKVSRMISAAYDGGIALARAIGEQDVALILEENRDRREAGIASLQRFIPGFFVQINSMEERKAA